MKGVVFTEFFEFVEEQYSPEFLQETIIESEIESKGVYTAIGTYPVCEMGALVGTLAARTGHDVPLLLKLFGRHMFKYFYTSSGHFFEGVSCPFDMLASVETKIHVDVKKLYPDAELPTFEILEHTKDRFVMNYKSARGLGDLCEGLIEECLEHFNKPATITRKLVAQEPITVIEFTLQV